MTNQEWKKRCVQRIARVVNKAGRIRIRDLMQVCHYHRGPKPDSTALWWAALDHLEKAKVIVVERDADGVDKFVMTPAASLAMEELAKWKRGEPQALVTKC